MFPALLVVGCALLVEEEEGEYRSDLQSDNPDSLLSLEFRSTWYLFSWELFTKLTFRELEVSVITEACNNPSRDDFRDILHVKAQHVEVRYIAFVLVEGDASIDLLKQRTSIHCRIYSQRGRLTSVYMVSR